MVCKVYQHLEDLYQNVFLKAIIRVYSALVVLVTVGVLTTPEKKSAALECEDADQSALTKVGVLVWFLNFVDTKESALLATIWSVERH